MLITSMILGLAAGLTRSGLTIAAVAMLIACAFVVATLSTGTLVFTNLFLAIAGYNLGLVELVLAWLVIHRVRAA